MQWMKVLWFEVSAPPGKSPCSSVSSDTISPHSLLPYALPTLVSFFPLNLNTLNKHFPQCICTGYPPCQAYTSSDMFMAPTLSSLNLKNSMPSLRIQSQSKHKSYMCVGMCVLRGFFPTPCTVALQALLSMRFSRQEHWSGLPCLPQGSSPPKHRTPVFWVSCIAGGFFTAEPPEKSIYMWIYMWIYIEYVYI